jgi:hypothetical protein
MRLALTGALNTALFESILVQCQPCIAGDDRELILDLSSAEWGFPSGLVPFASLLKSLTAKGIKVQMEAYPSPSVCAYFCRVDFFRYFGANSPCNIEKPPSGENRTVKITELHGAEIDRQTLDDLMKLLQRLPEEKVEATEVSRKSFMGACGELVSNTRHAYAENAVGNNREVLIQAQFYPKLGTVEICVCDRGLGVKRSMEDEHHQQPYGSNLEALEAALVFRNRNPKGDGEGLGLSAVQAYVKKNGGTLRVRSGDASKTQSADELRSTEKLPEWNGTIVVLQILVEKTTDLSKIEERYGR